ncbi:hypothetical protein L873DRAFT_1810220 [Choiromyces venosus 120613-1]|uniref:Uncharacterized protein n=1 Tax=Choiromyces venosus 120613-1 TaxID=1336337 RepID=A0A3N4JIR5_9PEZI|nr:hypothetical protein L873DRAFT_1810220 [Choiromyces venosus 120613-1]
MPLTQTNKNTSIDYLAVEIADKNNVSSLVAAVEMVGTAPRTLMHHWRGRKSQK